jgi:uncharacterized metal-binding protein YceD (DUF177 family)
LIIEFRKVPFNPSPLDLKYDDIRFRGNFFKTDSKTVKLEATLEGSLPFECCRCGCESSKVLEEDIEFLLSDGVFKDEDKDILVIEIEGGKIDFDDILLSEINSYKVDYNLCIDCQNSDEPFEREF